MIKLLKILFHFLGGIYLALLLISIAALMVIAGTFIESKTDSHLLAAAWTYEHPLFFTLLFLFFINILFAALRRWPFKQKHTPFLITHLGLLMIIGGTMIKNRFGLQGQLTVWEGSGNSSLQFPNSHALLIKKKQGTGAAEDLIAMRSFKPDIYHPFHMPQLKCKLVGYAPHVKEELETWMKGSHVHLAGAPPIRIDEWKAGDPPPEGFSCRLAAATSHLPACSILALKTMDTQEAIEQIYLRDLKLKLKKKGGEEETFSLLKVSRQPISWMGGVMEIQLEISPKENPLPTLLLTWESLSHHNKLRWQVPLRGQEALLVKPADGDGLEPPFTVDLIRKSPLLLFIEDMQGEKTLFAFDQFGRVHQENCTPSQLRTLAVYEDGFGGYGTQTEVPFPSFPAGREEKEKAEAHALTKQLKEAIAQHPALSPPLHLFEQACQRLQLDPCETFVQFLMEWQAQPGFIYHSQKKEAEPLASLFKNIDWSSIPQDERHAAEWAAQLLEQLEIDWSRGIHPLEVLKRHRWPFVSDLNKGELSKKGSLLNSIAKQMHSISGSLPPLDSTPPPASTESGKLISAYFRAYGIDYRSLLPYQGSESERLDYLEDYWKEKGLQELKQKVTLETPLSHKISPELELPKLEEQKPGIVLEVEEGERKQTIALAYDPAGTGLNWPLLNGDYLIRFQPNRKELPYRVRLRQARQLVYPQSQQVYSYESDVLIYEEGKQPVEYTLSMNNVYETADGYRFYLAGVGTSGDGTLQRIQLAVNYDPAKYSLTYPGAILVFIGTFFLFWGKRKKV